jgi:murein DD-endopeptidase / murein LD-carboxypeptidase
LLNRKLCAITFIAMFFRLISSFVVLLIVFFLTFCKSKQKTAEPVVQKKPTYTQKHKPHEVKNKHKTSDLESVLGVSSKEIKKSKLYSFIQDWYGVPYKYGGCKKSGVDCSCFINILYEQVYHQQLIGNAAELYNTSEKIGLNKVKEGDLVFFKINVSYVSHVGVFLRGDHFVHASTSKGVIVSSLNEAYYKKYFYGAGRLR